MHQLTSKSAEERLGYTRKCQKRSHLPRSKNKITSTELYPRNPKRTVGRMAECKSCIWKIYTKAARVKAAPANATVVRSKLIHTPQGKTVLKLVVLPRPHTDDTSRRSFLKRSITARTYANRGKPSNSLILLILIEMAMAYSSSCAFRLGFGMFLLFMLERQVDACHANRHTRCDDGSANFCSHAVELCRGLCSFRNRETELLQREPEKYRMWKYRHFRLRHRHG